MKPQFFDGHYQIYKMCNEPPAYGTNRPITHEYNDKFVVMGYDEYIELIKNKAKKGKLK
ncbi:hypothetical protein [Klebsiella pneumoniae]|uniref:hypothetical protein n=1 Tax=Klebsiella pneumoniae TaxID=573 RepID=UPI000E2DEB9B|nr:hypothetical protein [Klebsiella pneumoniae]SXB99910.1 Uncharacterised protein [Klebsiella pneumoniae]